MQIVISYLLRVSSMTLLMLCMANTAYANTRHEGWYQVEMIVFARRNPATEEQWPKTIKLRYPTRWVDLKDPNNTGATVSDPSTTTPVVNSIDFTTEAWWQLPADMRNLNDHARKLERNANYQLLFHQAWRQQITNARQATAILVNGGKIYGKHHEFEGSITLSVATYLKISTNLWFSQFDLNTDATALTSATEPETNTDAWPEIPLRPNYAAGILPTGESTPVFMENETIDPGNLITEETDTYSPRWTVLMKQERDMRSGEIHYLDHPLLGVIVRISPYRP